MNVVNMEDIVKKEKYSTCPYCGGEMQLRAQRWIGNYGRRSYNGLTGDANKRVAFECNYCGSTSPMIDLEVYLLDENKVAKDIDRIIEIAKKDILADENGEG